MLVRYWKWAVSHPCNDLMDVLINAFLLLLSLAALPVLGLIVALPVTLFTGCLSFSLGTVPGFVLLALGHFVLLLVVVLVRGAYGAFEKHVYPGIVRQAARAMVESFREGKAADLKDVLPREIYTARLNSTFTDELGPKATWEAAETLVVWLHGLAEEAESRTPAAEEPFQQSRQPNQPSQPPAANTPAPRRHFNPGDV